MSCSVRRPWLLASYIITFFFGIRYAYPVPFSSFRFFLLLFIPYYFDIIIIHHYFDKVLTAYFVCITSADIISSSTILLRFVRLIRF